MPTGATLGERLDDGPNGIGMFRLVLALAVLVSHAWVLGGFGPEPLVGFGRNRNTLGTVAVVGFFVLSGVLIARSWVRRPKPVAFLRHRALRIFPGFWICLVVIAFVIAPLGWHTLHATLSGYPVLGRSSAGGYLLDNFGLVTAQEGIRGTLNGVPYFTPPVGQLDGSLWTLLYEFACYLGVLALGVCGLLAKERRAAIAALTVVMLGALAYVVHNNTVVQVTEWIALTSLSVRVIAAFALGVTLFCFSDRIPMRRSWFVVASVLSIASLYAGWLDYGGLIPFAYVLVFIGLELPVRDLEAHGDLSYGIYLYAFPVQQFLALRAWNRWGVGVYIFLTLLFVVPLAAASWFAVERPALKWKSPGGRNRVNPDPPLAANPGGAGTVEP